MLSTVRLFKASNVMPYASANFYTQSGPLSNQSLLGLPAPANRNGCIQNKTNWTSEPYSGNVKDQSFFTASAQSSECIVFAVTFSAKRKTCSGLFRELNSFVNFACSFLQCSVLRSYTLCLHSRPFLNYPFTGSVVSNH